MPTFESLREQQFVNLTTFRRAGTSVVTPVWFVLYDDKLTVMTTRGTGKVKRIRNGPEVLIAPATRSDKQIGPEHPGKARVLELADAAASFRALGQKYGWLFQVFRFVQKLRRTDVVVLEIAPT